MAVITVSREFGSGGADIAQQVAQALGYHSALQVDSVLASVVSAQLKCQADHHP